MTFVVIDTETNGLYRNYYPKDYPDPELAGTPYPADGRDQARVVEIALIYCDHQFNVTGQYQAYIRPDGWEVDRTSKAFKKHGLTTEFLAEHGIPMVEALGRYHLAILSGRAVVAYNAQFDCKALRGEARRYGLPDLFYETRNSCAMRSTSGLKPKIIKLPDDEGRVKGGYPRLIDAAAHFGIPYPIRHTALDDARVTVEVAKCLQQAGCLLPPEVHLSSKHKGENAYV